MAVGDAHVFFSWLSNTSTKTTFFQKAMPSADVRGKNIPKRKFAQPESQTHNYQVMSPEGSKLNHPAGPHCKRTSESCEMRVISYHCYGQASLTRYQTTHFYADLN